MNKMNTGYFNTGDKISKITKDGLRINTYPSGIVTSQLPGQSHSEYKSNLSNNFSNMTSQQMADFTFEQFKIK